MDVIKALRAEVDRYFYDLRTKSPSEIKNLLRNFAEVELIELNNSMFGKVRLHRNNKFYGFVINVCHLINQNSLPSERPGE